MGFRTFGAAALLTAAGAAAAICAAPTAFAEPCDPAVIACPGGEAQPGQPDSGANDFSPPPSVVDQYPSEGDFFYNSPGPNEPAYSVGNGPTGGGSRGGGGGGGGGGGHR